jgi:Leucine-rich repeat (LRR) protein
LEELYLSQNGITAMVDLAPLTNLKILDLAQNRITKVRCPAA